MTVTARPDRALIRHLAETHSLEMAQAIARLPLFLIPDDATVLHDQEQVELVTASVDAEAGLQLPYADLLLDFPSGAWPNLQQVLPHLAARGRLWVRVRTVATALADPHLLLDQAHFDGLSNPADWLYLESWEAQTTGGGFAVLPDMSFVSRWLRDAAPDFHAYRHAYPNPQHLEGRPGGGLFCNLAQCNLPEGDQRRLPCTFSELLMATECYLALLALAYIDAQVSVTVRVRPSETAAIKPKVARQKPWLPPRAHYILIDPEAASADEYGVQARTAGPGRGAPRPHARRGHWRRLPAGFRKRVTRVSPAWIGPASWQHEGQRYQVVLPQTGRRGRGE